MGSPPTRSAGPLCGLGRDLHTEQFISPTTSPTTIGIFAEVDRKGVDLPEMALIGTNGASDASFGGGNGH